MQILKIGGFQREAVDRVFDSHDVAPPVILFDPKDSALGQESLRLFARISDRRAQRPGGAIRRRDFRLEEYGSMADFMAVVERRAPQDAPGRPGGAWVFAYSGPEIDFAQTEPLAGQAITCLSPSSATLMSEVWTHASADAGARVLTIHASPRDMLQSDWTVFSVPLLSDGEAAARVDGFAIYARASNRFSAGLDVVPDPIVILNEAREICMVNEAARHVFGNPGLSGAHAPSFHDYTQSDLELSSFRCSARRLRRQCRCLLNGAIATMDVSIGMMRHRGKEYMVVSFRPAP